MVDVLSSFESVVGHHDQREHNQLCYALISMKGYLTEGVTCTSSV